ncbi:Acb2/Tad1 domain-containing protein [Methylocaldum sp. MU1018]
MDNQHKLIAGYRDLTEDEIALMNEVKAKAAEVGTLVEKLRERLPAFKMDGEPIQVGDQTLIGVSEEAYETDRWMTIGTDNLQQGFMALIRAVARPTTF